MPQNIGQIGGASNKCNLPKRDNYLMDFHVKMMVVVELAETCFLMVQH